MGHGNLDLTGSGEAESLGVTWRQCFSRGLFPLTQAQRCYDKKLKLKAPGGLKLLNTCKTASIICFIGQLNQRVDSGICDYFRMR